MTDQKPNLCSEPRYRILALLGVYLHISFYTTEQTTSMVLN